MGTPSRAGVLLICGVAGGAPHLLVRGSRGDKTDIVGTWVPSKESQQWLSAADRSKCRIDLLANGLFSATLPEGMVSGVYASPSKLSAREGGWSLVNQKWQGTSVELHFLAAGRRIEHYMRLEARATRGGLELSDDIGDPDSGRRFVFQRSPGKVKGSNPGRSVGR